METEQPHWSSTVLYILAWLLCCVLIIVDILSIREASLDIVTALRVQRQDEAPEGQLTLEKLRSGFRTEALDKGFLFFGALVAVALALGLEYYFRTGSQKGKLLRRIGQVVGIQLAIILVCVVIQRLV
jgi:hypothetical protein